MNINTNFKIKIRFLKYLISGWLSYLVEKLETIHILLTQRSSMYVSKHHLSFEHKVTISLHKVQHH